MKANHLLTSVSLLQWRRTFLPKRPGIPRLKPRHSHRFITWGRKDLTERDSEIRVMK